MGTISRDTLRRLYLLYLLGRFKKGSYGSKRLHKIAYIPEREPSALRPFEFRRHHYGQYSDSLDAIKDQLISMGYVAALPLDTTDVDREGNRFFLTERANLRLYRRALSAVSSGLPRSIQQAVTTYGYEPEKKLVEEICYRFSEFEQTPIGEIIFESNVPDRIEIELSEEECEDLELALTPEVIVPMVRLAEALEEVEIDWTKVKKVERLPVPGS